MPWGRTEDGGEGIYVHTGGFGEEGGGGETFSFRQGRSRETAYSMDYDSIYELLKHERDHGNIIWVMGPACALMRMPVRAFAALVREGFVDGILAGNALATHDLEAGYRGTALGQDVYTQRSVPNGHYNHIDTINEVRRLGSIQAFVDSGEVRDGILYECVKKSVPFVLVGPSGMTARCPKYMEMCTRGRTPCGTWCGKPPRSSVWRRLCIRWPREI